MLEQNLNEEILAKGTIEKVVPFVMCGKRKIGLYEVSLKYKNKNYCALWRAKKLETQISRSIPHRTQYLRENAFFQVAKFFGIYHIPLITIRKIGRYVGSLQLMIGDGKRRTIGEVKAHLKSADSKVINRLAFLDFVCGNLDRHYGNILINDNKIWLIDNGLSFGSTDDNPRFNDYRNQVIRQFVNQASLPETLKELSSKISKGNFNGLISNLSKLLSQKEILYFKKRLNDLFKL